MMHRVLACLLLGIVLPWAGASAQGGAEPVDPASHLRPRHRNWLKETELLTSEAERAAFLQLPKDYQRDAFISRFWRSRDPFPQTGRNEFKERWEERLVLAKDLFGDLEGDRARMLLFNGEAEQTAKMFCAELLRPLEIWQYSGSELIRGPFALVFYSRGGSRGPYRLWYPSQGLQPLMLNVSLLPEDRGVLGGGIANRGDDRLAALISDRCARSEGILAGLSAAADWGRVEEATSVVPNPGEEWLRTFLARSTDLPAGVETFAAQLAISYPGRHQSRTVLQGVLSVAPEALPASESKTGGFVLDGEVLRKGELFEQFRYRFPLQQSAAVAGRLPLIFQRTLRPGTYQLIVKVEELASGRLCRLEMEVEVPSAQALASAGAELGAEGKEAAPGTEVARRLGEANSSLQDRDFSIEIFSPPARLLVGKARFEAVARGEGIARVRFHLDGKPVLAKTRPPYSVELDLGSSPRLHTLRATALDSSGGVLAADEVAINAGPHRFAVRLVEPRSGAQYVESLRAQAAVEVPEGERLERLEIYFNDVLMGVLYQPPFVQPILLPSTAGNVDYVRAVAYLANGSHSEDTVIVNSPQAGGEVDVHMVELFTTAVDRRGRPVKGLTRDDFTVFEEGVEQEVRRFELVEDLPIYAGLLLDTSQSMAEEIDEVVGGALAFFDTVLRPQDRAAVITFNDDPTLVVRFTNDRAVLAGGVAGLVAEGETALYDSLIYALFYFSEIRGKRTLILLSDGEDVESRYRYQDVIEYARRSGVTLYTVGFKLGSQQNDVRLKLSRLASETGGQAFFVQQASELERIYKRIENELRTQYLLAYQSTPLDRGEGQQMKGQRKGQRKGRGDGNGFRRVEVKVNRPGVEAKTIRGYYP